MEKANQANDEMRYLIESLANLKNVDQEIVFEAMEAGLAAVAQRTFEDEVDVRVKLNRDTAAYEEIVRVWQVCAADKIEEPSREISLEDAQAIDPGMSIGDEVVEAIEAPPSGRIAAQQAKHIIIQRLRAAERARIVGEYEEKIGDLVTGVVKKVTREVIIVDLGGIVEGLLPREDLIPREIVRVKDRIRAYLADVRAEGKGPQLALSRRHPQMLAKLFEIEVPEIAEQVIEVKAVARDPGGRSKIAVKSNDRRIDPKGTCIGMRGSRVQAVSNELNGERIDIILWDDNPAQLIINVFEPFPLGNIVIDEDKHAMDIAVEEEFLPQVIGRGGQNVRLATELTGWTINIMSEDELENKRSDVSENQKSDLFEHLEIDEEITDLLLNAGFTSIESIAYASDDDMLEIEEFDEETAEELRGRAKQALMTIELDMQEKLGDVEPAEDLLDLEDMTRRLALQLASKGIVTREDLAEQAVDDIVEIDGLDEALAGKFIMRARAHWFEEDSE